jgi:hypothetical protein
MSPTEGYDGPVTDADLSPSIHPDRLVYLITRITRSFLFFVVNMCWIENKTESGERIGETKFNLWPAQRPVCSLFLRHRLLAILKARQLGLTWLTAAYVLWRNLLQPGFLSVVISAKEDWAVEFLDRVRFMYNRLPEWLKKDLAKDGSQQMRMVFEWDPGEKKAFVYSDIKSLTTTQEGAQSKTPDLLVLDETARNRYVKEIFGASKPGIDKAGGQIIVISNAHKRGPGWAWTRDICSGAMRGENTFHFLFMPWWDCPERLTPEEVRQLEANPDFIPSEFKTRQLRDGVDPLDVSENYPDTAEEALATIQGSYFGDTLTRHVPYLTPGVTGTLFRDREGDRELYFRPREKGFQSPAGANVIMIWRYPYWMNESWNGLYWADRYCMGSDVSEGQGRTYSVAYVMDRQLDEFVCRIRGNRIDAVDWATYLNLVSMYYANYYLGGGGKMIARDRASVCVEKTGAGITTVKELAKMGANQYIRQIFDKRGDGNTDNIGWHEDRQAKHILCGDLKQWFKTCRGHVYDQVLVDEASTTIEHEGGLGNIGPEAGREWDSVVAAGCTIQASIQLGGPPFIVKPLDDAGGGGPVRSNWGL